MIRSENLTYILVELLHQCVVQKLVWVANVGLDCFRFRDRIVGRLRVEPVHFSQNLNELVLNVVHNVYGGLLRFAIEVMLDVE